MILRGILSCLAGLVLAGGLASCAQTPSGAAGAAPSAAQSPSNRPGAPIWAAVLGGDVKLLRPGQRIARLARGQTFGEGDTVLVGRDGVALLVFSNGLPLRLLPNSMLQIVRYRHTPAPMPQNAASPRGETTAGPSETIVYLNAGTVQGAGKLYHRTADLPLTVMTPAGAAGIHGDFSLTAQRDAAGLLRTVIVNCVLGSLDFASQTGASAEFSANGANMPASQADVAAVRVPAGGQLQLDVEQNAQRQIVKVSMAGAGLDRAAARQITTDFYATIFSTITDRGFVTTLPPPPQPTPPRGVPAAGMLPPAPALPPLPPSVLP